MKNIILIGAGGHAESCIDLIEEVGQYEIFGLLGFSEEIGRRIFGYSVMGDNNDLAQELASKCPNALVAVGQIKTAKIRKELFHLAKRAGFQLPSIIAPSAYVSRRAVIGEASIVMPGAVVRAGARVGKNCIINSHAVIEHSVEIGSYCHVASAAIVNGGAKIQDSSFIGSGTIVYQGIEIASESVIRAGSVVFKDITS
jgi:sugar O-acyltransferase (sialic acid O-acetyltransferase NeuD family)